MLVLNRQHLETITIFLPDGREIMVGINGYSAKKGVSVGIVAPKDIRVMRTEVMNRPDFVDHRTTKDTP